MALFTFIAIWAILLVSVELIGRKLASLLKTRRVVRAGRILWTEDIEIRTVAWQPSTSNILVFYRKNYGMKEIATIDALCTCSVEDLPSDVVHRINREHFERGLDAQCLMPLLHSHRKEAQRLFDEFVILTGG